MTPYRDEELTDIELSEMLAVWTVPPASPDLRARTFAGREKTWWCIWGPRGRSLAIAFVLQAGAVALAFLVFQGPVVEHRVKDFSRIYFPLQAEKPRLPVASRKASGGGSGMRAPKAFIPPAIAAAQPQLPVVSAFVTPQIADSPYGDPLSTLAGNSGGVGVGSGAGFGDGNGGGQGGGAYRIGGHVSAPILVTKTQPEYSEEARRAKYSGTVLLSIVVGVDGLPRNIHVVRPLGLGLDEKAVEAVMKWRFRPGMKGGKPVATSAQVEVNFRISG